MATVLTVREQKQTSAAARKVGGYEALLDLERKRRRLVSEGGSARVVRDAGTGQFVVQKA